MNNEVNEEIKKQSLKFKGNFTIRLKMA
jgi:hypothetical protein